MDADKRSVMQRIYLPVPSVPHAKPPTQSVASTGMTTEESASSHGLVPSYRVTDEMKEEQRNQPAHGRNATENQWLGIDDERQSSIDEY